MEAIIQDLRHGLRSLSRNAGFTAVAIATLALALGRTQKDNEAGPDGGRP